MPRAFICILSLISLHACRPAQQPTATLQLRLRHAIHRTVIIETLPGDSREARILHSATLRSNDETLMLHIAVDEEHPCRLHVRNTDLSVPFILHPGETSIEGDIVLPSEMVVVRSSVNTPLWAFLQRQWEQAEQNASSMEQAEQASDVAVRQQWISQYDSVRVLVQRDYHRYADTVSSPGAFLYTYTYVDFGRDFDSLKAFILRTEARFPHHTRVARLRARALDYLKTFEVELAIGDSLPPLALPDALGNRLPVSAPGRHLLVNFWSTWCNPCIAFLDEEKRLQPWIRAGRLQVVNIALDAEKDTWSFLTSTGQVPGLQLIDTGVWEGPVIRRWRIDSIPFNWLIGPDGRILQKAIARDALYDVLKKNLSISTL